MDKTKTTFLRSTLPEEKRGVAFTPTPCGKFGVVRFDGNPGQSFTLMRTEDRFKVEVLGAEAAEVLLQSFMNEGYVLTSKPWALFGRTGGFGISNHGFCRKADVEAWKEHLFREYHPAGYGTTVEEEDAPCGFAYIKSHRYSSCD